MGLIALEAAAPHIEPGEAEAVAAEWYGVKSRASALDGERDCNFRLETSDGRHLVLKFIDPHLDAAVVAGQCAVLCHLAEQAPDLPVPRIVRARDGSSCPSATLSAGSHRVRLITVLPGRLVSTLCPEPPLLRALGVQIGRLDRALRGFNHPALAQPLAWDIRQAVTLAPRVSEIPSPALRRLAADALAPVAGLLPRLRGLRSQAIHNDCHPRNLLADEAGERCTGIIDLGDMIHAPLVFEPAIAMAEFLNDRPERLEHLDLILAGYCESQPLEPEDLAVLHPLIGARIALGAVIQACRARSFEARQLAEDRSASKDQALAELAARALESLAIAGQDRLTARWWEAANNPANTLTASGGPGTGSEGTERLLRRRHAALGAHAELSYERPLHLVRGDGVWVYTASGERLLDVYNNVPHVGHAHPEVVAAIARQAARIASNTRYLDERVLEYSERLLARLPGDLDTCLFVNSGSEANDIAWRIARMHTGQSGALVMRHAYHGITEAVTDLSPATTRGKGARHVEQVDVPSDDVGATGSADAAQAVQRLVDRGFGVAALLIDSALTSTGIFDPPPQWSTALTGVVRAAGGLVIADEVQYGLGRSGSHFWGFERRGYEPDIVTLGKPVANGYPLGVVIARRLLLERFQRETGFFSTFGGNPVACAAGLAVLQVLDRERLLENARSTGEYFRDGLLRIAKVHPSLLEVRGCGLLLGVEVGAPPGHSAADLTRRIVNGLRQQNILIGSEGPRATVLKLRPPMPFGRDNADAVVHALSTVLRNLGRS